MTNRFLYQGLATLAVVSLASLLVPSTYAGNLLIWIAIAAVLASSLRFVLLIGELNFAIAAFVGLGAYTSGVMTNHWDLPFWLSLICSGLVALVVSAVFGFITLRIKGPYFLLIGFAFAEALRILYTRIEWVGGNSGMVGMFPPDALTDHFPAFVVLLTGAMILVMILIERSDLGRIFIAIRDNEDVVRSVGIRVHWVKVLCFCIASAIAGVAGSLQAFTNNVISPLDFTFLLSTFVLAYVKVGGEHHPAGPVLGGVIMVLLASFAQGFGGIEQVFYGAALVLCILFLPSGLISLPGLWKARRARALATSPREAR